MTDPQNKNKKYWFPAKKFGWGWGLPRTWKGWITFIVFLSGVFTTIRIFPIEKNPVTFMCTITVLSIIFILICWFKGEPPGKGKEKT